MRNVSNNTYNLHLFFVSEVKQLPIWLRAILFSISVNFLFILLAYFSIENFSLFPKALYILGIISPSL